MVANPFDNLTQAFAPQAQQAQLSTDQTRLLLQALRAEQTQRGYNPNLPPQLNTNVEARTPFEGIAKGIGAGLSSGLQLRAYGQQNKAIQQQQQQRQAAAMQQQALLQQQAQAEAGRQTNYLGSLKSNPVYAPLVMPYEMGNATTRGDIEKLVADNEAKRTFTPLLGTATGQGEFNKQNAIRTGAEGLGYGANSLEVNGAPQPVAINNYKMLTGQTPTLTQDLAAKDLANRGQEITNAGGLLNNQNRSIQNDFLPSEKAIQLRSDDANLKIKQIEAASKQMQVDLELEGSQLKNATSAADLKELQRKQTLLAQASEFKQNIADQLQAGKVPTPAQLLQLDAYNAALTDTTFDLTKALKAIQNPKAGQPVNAEKALRQKGNQAAPPIDFGLAPTAAKPLIKAKGGIDMAAAQAGANKEMATRKASGYQSNVTKGKALLSQAQQMESQARQGSASAKALMDKIDKALGM